MHSANIHTAYWKSPPIFNNTSMTTHLRKAHVATLNLPPKMLTSHCIIEFLVTYLTLHYELQILCSLHSNTC